jgi:hypothetical protein
MKNKTAIGTELLDQLLSAYSKPEELLGEDGLFKQLKKALIERALGDEPGALVLPLPKPHCGDH